MFIELIDVLRCTQPHEDTWLVAAFDRMAGRNVIDGLLSCPVCGARYPIADGVAYFDVPVDEPLASECFSGGEEELAIRAAAFLRFTEGVTLLLGGGWAGAAEKLAALGARLIVLNAEGAFAEGVSRIRAAGVVPCAGGSLHGIALDATNGQAVESAARALKPKGRLVASATAAVPHEMREIARDAEWWIAEQSGESVSAPVKLTRG